MLKDMGQCFNENRTKINSGIPHDTRSPDYDDWELNGDILFWNPVLKKSF